MLLLARFHVRNVTRQPLIKLDLQFCFERFRIQLPDAPFRSGPGSWYLAFLDAPCLRRETLITCCKPAPLTAISVRSQLIGSPTCWNVVQTSAASLSWGGRLAVGGLELRPKLPAATDAASPRKS